jgi:hypothetical protein
MSEDALGLKTGLLSSSIGAFYVSDVAKSTTYLGPTGASVFVETFLGMKLISTDFVLAG